jgi:hypothetical protein
MENSVVTSVGPSWPTENNVIFVVLPPADGSYINFHQLVLADRICLISVCFSSSRWNLFRTTKISIFLVVDEYSWSVCCWIGVIRWAAQPNAWSRVLKPKNVNPNQQKDSTTMNMNSTKQLKNKNRGSKGYKTTKNVYFFGFFNGVWYKDKKLTRKHMIIPHGNLSLIPLDERLGPNLSRGRGRSIRGDLRCWWRRLWTDDRNLAITTSWLRWLPTGMHMSWPHLEGLSLQVQPRTQAKNRKECN